MRRKIFIRSETLSPPKAAEKASCQSGDTFFRDAHRIISLRTTGIGRGERGAQTTKPQRAKTVLKKQLKKKCPHTVVRS